MLQCCVKQHLPGTYAPALIGSTPSFAHSVLPMLLLQAFKGIWRIQVNDEDSTFLHYSLFVKPHPWLPVGLIQSRIKNEVVNNLKAVRRHCEHVQKRNVKQQQQQQAGAGALSSASSSTMSSTMSTSSSVGTDADDTAGSAM
jgi:hypothetical protein